MRPSLVLSPPIQANIRLARRIILVDEPGNPHCRGRISTIDHLALTSLYQLIFILKILSNFATKQAVLMRRLMEENQP